MLACKSCVAPEMSAHLTISLVPVCTLFSMASVARWARPSSAVSSIHPTRSGDGQARRVICKKTIQGCMTHASTAGAPVLCWRSGTSDDRFWLLVTVEFTVCGRYGPPLGFFAWGISKPDDSWHRKAPYDVLSVPWHRCCCGAVQPPVSDCLSDPRLAPHRHLIHPHFVDGDSVQRHCVGMLPLTSEYLLPQFWNL